jgi:hypothetical protein
VPAAPPDGVTRPFAWSRRRLGAGIVILVAVIATWFCTTAHAETYRCEVDGKTLYSDAPCAVGKQTGVIADDPSVGPTDKAAAAARLRADKATLADLDRRRAQELKEDQQAAALAAKRGRSPRPCAKLELRARRAHEDFARAAPKDQEKARSKMQRTEDDYSALCKR